MSKGWITIERDIQEHWIFKDAEKLRAWLIVLMQVNHKENKSLIKGKLMTCSRGESLMSHNSWAEKFGKNWNRSKVIRFFKLLETDHMIVQHNEQVTTRLSVCNYSQYQDKSKKSEQANEHQPEQVALHQANTERTGGSTQLNNDNNDNNDNNVNKKDNGAKAPRFNFKKSLLELGVDESIVSDWLLVRKRKKASNTETAFKTLLTELGKTSLSPNEAIKLAASNSWAGFKSEWAKNIGLGRSTNKPAQQSFSDKDYGEVVGTI